MDDVRILLTNDDGIEAPGIEAMYRELDAHHDVTVVAPARNQSGVGRTRNGDVTVADHEWGYELAGTPADCVAFGLEGIEESFDVVVSGINDGPNLGNYVVGRSGTVGAGIEAAFLDVPAIAVSAYHSTEFFPYPPEEFDFSRPATVARRILEAVPLSVYEEVDLLNVNAPVDVAAPGTRLTHMLADYEQRVFRDPEESDVEVVDEGHTPVRLVDKTWPHVEGFENPFPEAHDHRERYPENSDRRAVLDGDVSVSPMSIHHEYVESAELADLFATLDLDLG